jgi:hypothetical protein
MEEWNSRGNEAEDRRNLLPRFFLLDAERQKARPSSFLA